MSFKSYKYPLLNDKKWLREKYEVKGLSTTQVAKLAGAKTANSARQALIRHGINVRSIGEGLTHNREDDGFIINHEVIEGCLLGDASLRKWKKDGPNANAYFAKTNKYYDHIAYVSSLLFPAKKEEEAIKEKKGSGDYSHLTHFHLRSLTRPELNVYFERWYPHWNDYNKVVPEDIEITPTVLLHWFLDDGSSYRRKDRSTKGVYIILSTECFSLAEQNMLCEKIMSTFGIYCKPYPTNSGVGHRICVTQSQTKAVYEVIGYSPVSSLRYKWKM